MSAFRRNIKLFSQRLPTALATLYTVPAPTSPNTDIQVLATQVTVSINQSGKIWLYLVPNGGVAGDDNVIWEEWPVDQATIAARATYWVMEQGDTVQAYYEKADAATLRFDGLEIQKP